MADKLTSISKKKNTSKKYISREIKKFLTISFSGLSPVLVSAAILYFAPANVKLGKIEYDLEFMTLSISTLISVIITNIALDKAKTFNELKKNILIFEIFFLIAVLSLYIIKKCFKITVPIYIVLLAWILGLAVGVIDIFICNYKKEKRSYYD